MTATIEETHEVVDETIDDNAFGPFHVLCRYCYPPDRDYTGVVVVTACGERVPFRQGIPGPNGVPVNACEKCYELWTKRFTNPVPCPSCGRA